jgi:hypothetical protein
MFAGRGESGFEEDVVAAALIEETDAAALCNGAALSEANDSDGSRVVDLDLCNKDFEGAGGTDEDKSICDAGCGVPDEEDVGGFLESSAIVKEELDAGDGALELDNAGGDV